MTPWWDNAWLWSGISIVVVAAIAAVVAIVLIIWFLDSDKERA